MRYHGVLCFLLSALTLLCAAQAAADPVLSAEGISGDIDDKHRAPVLSVSISRPTGSGPRVYSILADAYVANDEFVQYPMRFDFYVNRTLFASQFRSKELPGPVGVDVGPSIAVPPFNYTVIATILHPNHTYTTIIQGAVFAAGPVSKLDCTLTVTKSGDEPGEQTTIFTASDVEVSQQDSNAFALKFEGKNESSGGTALVEATIVNKGQDQPAAGSVTITADGAPQTQTVTGEIEITDGALNSFSVGSEDESTDLSCS